MSSNYWNRYWNRRRLLSGAGALGLGAAGLALVGCGDKKGSTPGAGAGTTTSGASPTSGSTSKLVPPGLEAVYPLIAKYHWSKLSVSKNQPKRGGRLKLRLLFDSATWDPFEPGTAGVQNVPMNLFYNRLLKANLSHTDAMAGKGNLFELDLKGDLAKTWEQPDQTTYVFHLYDNIKWFDIPPVSGRAMTSEDIRYTYEAYVAEKAVAQTDMFRDVVKFETPDPKTFKITTRKPSAYLINSLAAPLAFVVAREAREKGLLKQDPPIGTGPFVMNKHTYRNTLQVDRNPAYFRPGRPYLDGVDFTWILDPTAAIAAYRTGALDTINYVFAGGFDVVDQLLKSEGWTGEGGKSDLHVNQMNSGGNTGYFWRHDVAPFNDVRVRRALSMGLNREKQIAGISGGEGKGRYSLAIPTDWVALPGKPWPYAASDYPKWYQHNRDAAKALLADAGFQPGQLKLELLGASGTGPPAPILALIQEDWKAIGVEANIRLIDTVALQGLFYGNKLGPFQVLGGVSTSSGLDLDDFTFRVLHSQSKNNQIGLKDPELDKLLEAQQAEFDRAKRTDLGRQIAARDLDQLYRLWMTTTLYWEMKRPYVQNWTTHDVYMFMNGWALSEVEDTWLDR